MLTKVALNGLFELMERGTSLADVNKGCLVLLLDKKM